MRFLRVPGQLTERWLHSRLAINHLWGSGFAGRHNLMWVRSTALAPHEQGRRHRAGKQRCLSVLHSGRTESGAGKTPALADHQARELLAAPQADTLKSKRDRAILSTLLFHALRREELCKLKVRDFRHARKGVPHLKVSGKGGKTRYLPLHPGTNALIRGNCSPR
jgi:integrase